MTKLLPLMDGALKTIAVNIMETIFGEIKMNYNLLMREVPNGCIIIDAQPSRQKLWGRVLFGLQTYATIRARVPNPICFANCVEDVA